MQDAPLSVQSPKFSTGLNPPVFLLLWLGVATLALHWLVLGDCWQPSCKQPPVKADPSSIQVRTISNPIAQTEASAKSSGAAPPKAVGAPPKHRPQVHASKPTEELTLDHLPATDPQPLMAAAGVSLTEPLGASAAPPPTEAASEPTETQPLPTPSLDATPSRVTVPPGFSATYAFRRGSLSGAAELNWSPGPESYSLRMHIRKGVIPVMTQTSEGRLDKSGLEPERFVDSRLGRNAQAANFQKTKGIISFSGPSQTYTWQSGAQDRLSWMVQLPAILLAQQPTAGQRFAMTVVGARGEADVWTFQFIDWETVTTPSGPVRGAKLVREARRPHDQQVEIWLDPEKSYQPVRARWVGSEDTQSIEMLRD